MQVSVFNNANSTRKRSEGISRKNNFLIPFAISFFLAVACLSFQNRYLRIESTANLQEKQAQTIEPTALAGRRNEDNSRISMGNGSIFNCDGTNGRCVYFYATKFFHPENGIGKEYRYILEQIESLRQKRQLWANMPRIGFPTFSFYETALNPMTNQPFYRHNVTFIHVHKAGGTSLHNYASSLQVRRNARVTRHPLYQWHSPGEVVRSNTELAYFHLSTAGKYKQSPEEWGKDDHVMFAFIRDPLERFISSIGQAMGAQGSQSNVVGKVLQSRCINGTVYSQNLSRKTIQCCINYIQENGFYFEIHFTPQAVEIAFATQMYHIPVAVFKFEESYSSVLKEMGANPDVKHRDGDVKGYRPNPVLTGMTSADYTPELISQICKLYQIDVILHRSLGWDVPRCAGYV